MKKPRSEAGQEDGLAAGRTGITNGDGISASIP